MRFEEVGDIVPVERVGINELYLEGHAIPYKGIPTIQGLRAANCIKRLAKGLPWTYRQMLTEGTEEVQRALKQNDYWLNSTVQVYAFTRTFLGLLGMKDAKRLATFAAHIFEYDQAYRFRIQDLAGETTKEALMRNPQAELLRLVEIHRQRDYNVMSNKVKKVARLCYWALYLPRVKRAFRKAIEATNFELIQPDENDKYWMRQKVDYHYAP